MVITDASIETEVERPDLWSSCEHAPVIERCKDGWCEIPGGCFVMGSPEDEWGRARIEEQQALVRLTRTFLIRRTELTQAEWTSHGLYNPSSKLPDGTGDCAEPECPVGGVTWFEALAYANLMSERNDPPLEPCYVLHGCQGEIGKDFYCTGAEATKPTVYDCNGFRLPTDAEWEYAARAGTRTPFYSGDITAGDTTVAVDTTCFADENLAAIGWYCHNSNGTTHPVAQLEPNAWGLFDMSGNANEWINDHSDGRPATSEVDPGGTVELYTSRNMRGGGFYSWSTLCRSASQLEAIWDHRRPALTVRLARTATLDDL